MAAYMRSTGGAVADARRFNSTSTNGAATAAAGANNRSSTTQEQHQARTALPPGLRMPRKQPLRVDTSRYVYEQLRQQTPVQRHASASVAQATAIAQALEKQQSMRLGIGMQQVGQINYQQQHPQQQQQQQYQQYPTSNSQQIQGFHPQQQQHQGRQHQVHRHQQQRQQQQQHHQVHQQQLQQQQQRQIQQQQQQEQLLQQQLQQQQPFQQQSQQSQPQQQQHWNGAPPLSAYMSSTPQQQQVWNALPAYTSTTPLEPPPQPSPSPPQPQYRRAFEFLDSEINAARTNTSSHIGGISTAVVQPGDAIVPPEYRHGPLSVVEAPRMGPPAFHLPFVHSHNEYSGFSYGGYPGSEYASPQQQQLQPPQQQQSSQQSISVLMNPPSTVPVTFAPYDALANEWSLADKRDSLTSDSSTSNNASTAAQQSTVSSSRNKFGDATWTHAQHFSHAASTINPSFNDSDLRAASSHSSIFHSAPPDENMAEQLSAAKTLFGLQLPTFTSTQHDVAIHDNMSSSVAWPLEQPLAPAPTPPSSRGPRTDDSVSAMTIAEQNYALTRAGDAAISEDFLVALQPFDPSSALAMLRGAHSQSHATTNQDAPSPLTAPPDLLQRPLADPTPVTAPKTLPTTTTATAAAAASKKRAPPKRSRATTATTSTTTSGTVHTIATASAKTPATMPVIAISGDPDGWFVPAPPPKPPRARAKPKPKSRVAPAATEAPAEPPSAPRPSTAVPKKRAPVKRRKTQDSSLPSSKVMAAPAVAATAQLPLPSSASQRNGDARPPLAASAERSSTTAPSAPSAVAAAVNVLAPVPGVAPLPPSAPSAPFPKPAVTIDTSLPASNSVDAPVPAAVALSTETKLVAPAPRAQPPKLAAIAPRPALETPASTQAVPTLPPPSPLPELIVSQPNNTVMIFCKRDFLRYQAVKLYKKYHEKRKKMESQIVQVYGKRTRYVNTKYESEPLVRPAF